MRLPRALVLTAGILVLFAVAVLAWRSGHSKSSPRRYAQWKRLPPALAPHRESASTVIDGKLYVFGGHYNTKVQTSSTVQVLEPRTGTWTRRAPLPAATTHWNAAPDGRTVWLAGGFVGDHPGVTTTAVWRYDAVADRWSKGPPLPESRGSGALVLVDHALHYLGGFLPDRRSDSPEHWRLSLDDDSGWTARAPLPQPRGQLSGVVLDGKLYAIGGQFGHDQGPYDVALVHRYDPATDRWTEAARLPHPVSHAESSTFTVDGQVLVIGGRNHQEPRSSDGRILASVLLYDPPRDLWITLDHLPLALTGPAAAVIGSELIVSGGGRAPSEKPVADTWALPFRDAWRPGPSLPTAVAEVAAGVIGRYLYVVGEGTSETLRYDLSAGGWTGGVAPRPFPGDHHAAEVVGGKLYLFGGFKSEGRTQIYDPAVDAWRLGAPMPFAAASSASAAIDGKVYLAGGIVDDSTTPETAVYDPESDSWRRLAPMPLGRNHAAYATDGHRLFVFGGRGKGSGERNVVANGFADVQIYDPAANRWSSSADPGDGIAPLPQGRGGMGKAVYLAGRFYVFGGETRDGPGANGRGVYGRVDIYDQKRNLWLRGRDMPAPRHGIFPVEVGGRVFIAGGGTHAGGSRSAIFDYYSPPAFAAPGFTAAAAKTPAARRPSTDSMQ